jgi:putative Holliday junction resolvase
MSPLSPTRILALDVGNRRVGVAVGSVETGMSTPLEIVVRGENDRSAIERLRELVRREEAGTILVGDPLNMDGSVGEQATRSRAFAQTLKRAIRQVRIELFDERLSSFEADEWMDRDEISSRKRPEWRDAYAAAVILQDYLDVKAREKKRDEKS